MKMRLNELPDKHSDVVYFRTVRSQKNMRDLLSVPFRSILDNDLSEDPVTLRDEGQFPGADLTDDEWTKFSLP